VLGEFERRAAVADREIGAAERAVLAGKEFVLQLARVHALHEIVRARADLHARLVLRMPEVLDVVALSTVVVLIRAGLRDTCTGRQHRGKTDERQLQFALAHRTLPSWSVKGAGIARRRVAQMAIR